MATVPPPPPPPSLHPLPAVRRRASAVRRFPLGCGRQHSNAAPPPRRPVPTPYSANGAPPPNPSARAAAAKTSSSPAADRFPGTEGHDRGGAGAPISGTKAPAAAEVVVRRRWAVRRYPPGCGRGVPVPKPETSVVARDGEGGSIEVLVAACDVEAQATAGDREVVPSASTLENGEAKSDGAGKSGGDGGGALEGCGSPGPPSTANAIMLAPLVPWAHHGQRSQQRRKTL
uniref:Uncharacterized protein n=1 Tax=Avena sativa TaxID=4498 RepID=A0ACD5XQJ5_AVESA